MCINTYKYVHIYTNQSIRLEKNIEVYQYWKCVVIQQLKDKV